MPAASSWQQTKVMLMKNLLIKWSSPRRCSTFFEIVYPMAYVVFAIGFAQALGNFDYSPVEYFNASQPYPPLCPPGHTIAVTPDGPAERALVEGALASIYSPCNVTGYADYPALRTALLANDSALRLVTPFAVVLDLPTSSYTMLVKALDSVGLNTDSPSGLTKYTRAYGDDSAEDSAGISPWIHNGGLLLEVGLDSALAEAHTPGARASMLQISGYNLKTARLPTGPFKSKYAPGTEWFKFVVPMYITLGSTMLGMFVMRPMVVEREKRLLEGMSMMGLTTRANNNALYLTFALTQGLAPVVSTFVTVAIGFISWDANIGYLFITMLLHTIDCIVFIIMLVPLCRSSASSELFTMILMLIPGCVLFVVCGVVKFPPGFFWPICLISTAAAPLGIALFLEAEYDGHGLTDALDTSESKPLIGVWAFQIFDALLYAFLAWYFDQVIAAPGSAAHTKRWDFILPRCLQCSGATELPVDAPAGVRELARSRSDLASSSADGPAVQALHLKKTYPGTPTPVHAVVDLSFEMAHGEVTGLLGQNGAGKSTAIHMLCGLVKPTSGAAIVFKHNVGTEMDQIRSMSGICPQHDLLFDELTVLQHITLFAGIKGANAGKTREEVTAWLERLGIGYKANSNASELSGGQRRKLSLIIALVANPKFVLLDEPTAGMDPESRRAVHDFVLATKGDRATLLTTHFMDEADRLCSSIVVVSKGLLAAVGSPSHLKAKYASGYHLVAALSQATSQGAASQGPSAHSHALLEVTQRHVPGAILEETSPEQASLILPAESSAAFASLFAELDAASHQLGVTSYGVSLPSLQEAFVKILDAQKGAGGYAELRGAPAASNPSDPLMRDRTTSLSNAQAGRLAQMRVVASKALMEYTADLKPTLLKEAILIVIVVFAFIIGPLTTTSGSHESNLAEPTAIPLNPAPFKEVRPDYPLPYLPSALSPRLADGSTLQTLYGYAADPSSLAVDYSDPTGPQRALSESLHYLSGAFAAFALPNVSEPSSLAYGTTLLYNASYPHSLPAYAAMLDAALIEYAAPGLTITPKVGKLPAINDGKSAKAMAATMSQQISPILVLLALLQIVLVTASKLGAERFNHTKQLLLLSGLDVRAFWCGFALSDALRYLLLIVGVGAIAGGTSGGLDPIAVAPIVIVELCALPGVLFLAYLVTLPFKTPENAVVCVMLVFFFGGLLPTLLLSFISSPTAKLALQIVLLVQPPMQIITGVSSTLTVQAMSAFNVAYGIGEAYTASDYFAITFESIEYDPVTYEPKRGTVVGPGLVMIIAALTSLLFAALFYRLEIGKFTRERKLRPQPTSKATDEDADVAAERARVASLPNNPTAAAVKVVGLSKRFVTSKSPIGQLTQTGPTLTAVDNLSFAIPAGTCFALLGPNGAGKTTAINVLTGDLAPSSGETSLHGLPSNGSLMEVFKVTGFCPQLKGLWPTLTLRQHLTIILRLKGLEGAALQEAVAQVENGYGLEEHAHKMAKKLSGGTQRKLSCAIALSCGSPQVVFVDEPTTGVDVGTRRFIWDRIKEASKERVVMLTTHYMDEADALAQRIGIMAAGKLRVIGSPQHLKSTHGGGYRVELKAPAESEVGLTQLVNSLFTDVTRTESHQGTLVFEVAASFKLAGVFSAFEEAKQTLGLDTFTMSQTTLEEVFLRVAEQFKGATKKQIGLRRPPTGMAAPNPVTAPATLGAASFGHAGQDTAAPSGSAAPMPNEMSTAPLPAEYDMGPVKAGWYINGCLNIYWKITPKPMSEPPEYRTQCMCFGLEWIIPIPCCCCPAGDFKLQPDDPNATGDEEGAYIFQGGNSIVGKRHVWKEDGKFISKDGSLKEDGTFVAKGSKETMKLIYASPPPSSNERNSTPVKERSGAGVVSGEC